MKKQPNLLQRIRLVYKPSAKLTKIVVACTATVCLVALLAMQVMLTATQRQNEAIRHHAAQLEQVNAQLEKYIGDLGSLSSIIRIAEDELGLMDPRAIILDPKVKFLFGGSKGNYGVNCRSSIGRKNQNNHKFWRICCPA